MSPTDENNVSDYFRLKGINYDSGGNLLVAGAPPGVQQQGGPKVSSGAGLHRRGHRIELERSRGHQHDSFIDELLARKQGFVIESELELKVREQTLEYARDMATQEGIVCSGSSGVVCGLRCWRSWYICSSPGPKWGSPGAYNLYDADMEAAR